MIDFDAYYAAIQSSVELMRQSAPSPVDQVRLLPNVFRSLQPSTGLAAQAIRRALLASIARAVADYTIASKQEAQTMLDTLLPLFDAELLATDELQAHRGIHDLRTALVKDLTTRGLRAPDLVSVTYPAPMPTFVIAQKLYLDGSRADEITLRNDPVHPLFCNPTVEVLVR